MELRARFLVLHASASDVLRTSYSQLHAKRSGTTRLSDDKMEAQIEAAFSCLPCLGGSTLLGAGADRLVSCARVIVCLVAWSECCRWNGEAYVIVQWSAVVCCGVRGRMDSKHQLLVASVAWPVALQACFGDLDDEGSVGSLVGDPACGGLHIDEVSSALVYSAWLPARRQFASRASVSSLRGLSVVAFGWDFAVQFWHFACGLLLRKGALDAADGHDDDLHGFAQIAAR